MLKVKLKLGLAMMLCGTVLLGACVSSKSAKGWFNKGEWKNGLAITPYADINKSEFEAQYKKNKKRWDKAFAFLKNTNLETLKPGKYPIDGDSVFASVTEWAYGGIEKTNWESHRKMIDIQYVIKGKEKIGVAPLSDKVIITKPYDDLKDVANYTTEGKFYIAEPGTMYIFFPTDLHRPNIKVDGYDMVKKIVIKVRYTK